MENKNATIKTWWEFFIRSFVSVAKDYQTLLIFAISLLVFLYCSYGALYFNDYVFLNDLLYDFDYRPFSPSFKYYYRHPFYDIFLLPCASLSKNVLIRIIINSIVSACSSCIIYKILDYFNLSLKILFTLLFIFSFSVITAVSVLDLYVFASFSSVVYFYYICILKKRAFYSFSNLFILSFLVYLNMGINIATILYCIPLLIYLFKRKIKYYIICILLLFSFSVLGVVLQTKMYGEKQSVQEYVISRNKPYKKEAFSLVYSRHKGVTIKGLATETVVAPFYSLSSKNVSKTRWKFDRNQSNFYFLPYFVFLMLPCFFLKKMDKIVFLFLLITILSIISSSLFNRWGNAFLFSSNYIVYYIMFFAIMYKTIPIRLSLAVCLPFLLFQIINNFIIFHQLLHWVNLDSISYSLSKHFLYVLLTFFTIIIPCLLFRRYICFIQKDPEFKYRFFTYNYLLLIGVSVLIKCL